MKSALREPQRTFREALEYSEALEVYSETKNAPIIERSRDAGAFAYITYFLLLHELNVCR